MMDEVIAHLKVSRPCWGREIRVYGLFLAKYGCLPQVACVKPCGKENEMNVVFHVGSLLRRIFGDDNNTKEKSIVRRYFHPCSKKFYAFEQLLPLPDVYGVLLSIGECLWVTNYRTMSKESIQPDYLPGCHYLIVRQIRLFYLPEHEFLVQKLIHNLIGDEALVLVEPKTVCLRLICRQRNRCIAGNMMFKLGGSTYIKKPLINSLALSYGGDDFLNVHQKILTWLNKKDVSGLVLLHGAPGSGKTSYVRYLLNCLTDDEHRTFIYFPSDMADSITSPSLIPLILSHQNCVLIIEDAEGSLSQLCTSNQSVANLLNLSNGLFSDGTHIKIIATFNCPLISLDPALLRPGCLVVQHCFPSTLTIESARQLADSIGVEKANEINEPMPLANVYALRNDNIIEEQDEYVSSTCNRCVSCNYVEEEE